ncbi:MAG: alpha/beta fold hydrolase [Archangium sp.]
MKRALLVAVLALSACPPSTATPRVMPSVKDSLADGPAKCLLVFLPGIGNHAKDFETQGFLESLRKKNLSVDVVAADATFGYYIKGLLIDRLHEDVVQPAKQQGHYEHTWLVGISLGGMGAIRYASKHAEEIDGALLIAPYLGDPRITRDIRNSGGLAKWEPLDLAAAPTPQEAELRDMWRWLQSATKPEANAPLLSVSYGTEDKFAPQAELIADALPRERVMTMKGTHQWATWLPLFQAFLSDSEFTRACGR